MAQFTVQVKGMQQTVVRSRRMSLLWVLRDLLCLNAPNTAAESGCGGLSVHLNGAAARSCQIEVTNAVGKQITIIEGWGKMAPIRSNALGSPSRCRSTATVSPVR